VSSVVLTQARRWTAVACFRLSSWILRMSMQLYRRRAISAALLRATLSVARSFERAGGVLALGRRRGD